MKKAFKISRKIALFVLTLVFVLIGIGVIPNISITKNPNKITLSADTWNSELAEINKGTAPTTTTYVSISDYVTLNENGLVTAVKDYSLIKNNKDNTVIKIETGLDLYYFSELCNPWFSSDNENNAYTDFLTFNYILGADINYEDASQTFKMLRPIGWNGDYSFSGTFDGLGYTISNIFYRPFESEEEVAIYNGLIYLALFSVNTGIIKNVGIINPNMIQYDTYEGVQYATPFIGLNKNIVENCYVQDLRGNSAGMSAEGGYITTMFAAANAENATIKNCYVAVDRITSPTISMTSTNNRYPFIEVNSGTMENCYYDAHILDLNTTYNKTSISGLTSLQTTEFLDQSKFEYYTKENDEIVDQIWFSDATYKPEYSSYLKSKYPVLRGFEVIVVDDEEYFAIKNANDLVLMSQYIDQYQAFRTASYLLVNSVDLNNAGEDAFVFTDAVFSGKLVGTTNNSDGYSVELADGTKSNHTSIFNLKITKGNSYNGYRAYGLFSVLSGTIENINLVNVTINESDITEVNLSEINTLGAVCGLLEGGTINNVNVEVDITLNNGTTTFLGTQQVGGIAGTVLDGTISNSTTTGTLNAVTYDNPGTLTKDNSHSIGGIVGKVEQCDSINNCLNNIEINNISYSTNPGTAVRQYIGGVIGCGGNDDEKKENYISNTYELQNNQEINVNNGTYYSLVYVGGIIGRVIDAKGSNGVYLNNANINYNVTNNNYKAYISGVMNVISKVADKYDTFNATGLTYQTVQNELNAQTPFEFTSLSNGGLLNISNGLTSAKYPAKYSIITNVTNGIDIRTAGISYSYLTKMNVLGGYNLNYHYERNGSTIKEEPNNPQEIDVSMIDEYGPAFNADNKVAFENNELGLDTNYLSVKTALQTTVNLERVYNFANLNYVTHGEVNSYMMQLSGCVNGRNFNLKNVRNDGNIKVYFTDDASALSYRQQTYGDYFDDHKKLKIFGVMEEVSLNHRAEDIYNGGNITFSSQTGIAPNYNLYIAGICYKNVGNDDTSTQKLLLERGYVGSLHNAVNNGDIRTTNGNILENDNLVTPCTVYGYSRIGGITCINSSTISQTFNLGDLYNINHIQAPSGNSNTTRPNDGHFEVETGGICYIMQNEEYDNSNRITRGNIIDSANNGTVIAMNTAVEREVGNDENGFTNAGGFVARNDRGEDGYRVDETASIVQNSHISKIQYSINYGDVYAYNAIQGVKYETEQQSKAAGFVCLGACTIVDAINYGNIYGNSVSAGIFGYLYISRMRTAGMGPNSPIYIANSVNYGQVKVLRMTDNNKANIPVCRSTNYKPEVYDEIPTTGNSANGTTIRTTGALIGVWAHRNNDDDLNSMIIKYLINFVDDLNILGLGVNNYGTSNAVITSKYNMLENMATTNPNDTSPAPFDTDNNNHRYGIKSYYKDSSAGNKSLDDIYSQAYNGGIFNENYSIRTPGELTYDANGNVDQNDTDNFIADYIQFVPYSKVNEYLIEKIGLKEVVEENAYANALTNVELIKQVLYYKNPGNISDVYNQLLNANQTTLNNSKNAIANAIINYLKENPEKSIEIAQILIDDKEVVKQILGASEIQEIITKLFNNLTEEEINAELLAALSSAYSLEGFVNNEDNNDLITTIINRYANQDNITDSEKAVVNNIFNALINNESAARNYVNSLTNVERNTLVGSLYSLVQNDEQFLDLIVDTYFETALIANNADFNKLKDAIIGDRITNGEQLDQYPITDQEYIAMYNELNSSYVDTMVEEEINSLTNAELRTLLNNLNNAIGTSTSNAIYYFLESGRSRTGNIYLKASASNYVAFVNTTNNVYGGNTGTKNDNQTYTGTHQSINGNPNNQNQLIEILIESNSYYHPVTATRRNGNTTNIYAYWTFNDNTFTAAQNRNSPTDTYYKISLIEIATLNNATYDFVVNENHSGVYANYTERENSVRYNNNNYYYDTYDFTSVTRYEYINYGSGSTAKNGGDLTAAMITQMLEEVPNNNTVENISNSEIKSYLMNIYDNSTEDKNAFIQVLIPGYNPNVTIDIALEYLNNLTYSAANVNVMLNNISSEIAKANIVKLINDQPTDYVDQLYFMLLKYDKNSGYQITADIISDVYSNLYNNNSNEMDDLFKSILYSDGSIWDELTLDEKKIILSYYYSNSDMGVDLLYDAVINKDPLLNNNDYNNIIKQMLIADISDLSTYKDKLNPLLTEDLMAEISSIIISKNTTLFNQYIGLTQNGIIEELEDMEIDSSIVTDFTGIYALASSMGIEAGLFLPDNISLIDLDKYYTNESGVLVNDPEWRGGTYEDPNKYTEGVRSVNYKVYYEMKQLKKSIATIIFKMELTDENNEYVVDNNLEYDYYCNYKEKDENGNPIIDADGNHIIKNEVYFYIPINNDILYQDKLLINMNKGSYELSYGASFDEDTNKFEIDLRSSYVVGEVLEDTFVVQAEDTKVKTKYTLYVTITNPAYLDPLTSVVVDGNNSTHVDASATGSKGEVITNTVVNTAVKGYNGKIVLNYGTANMNNGLSLLSNVHVYKTELTTLPTSVPSDFSSYLSNELVLGKDYIFNNTINNGIVVIAGQNGTGFNNNGYPSGTVFFDISLDNYQTKGIYLIEIEINESTKYYTLFEKAISSEANLNSLSFNGQTYANNGTDINNQNNPSYVEYGTPLDEEFFKFDGKLSNDIIVTEAKGTLNPDYYVTYNNTVAVYRPTDSNAVSPTDSLRIAVKLNPFNNRYYVTGVYSSGAVQALNSIDYDYLIVVSNQNNNSYTDLSKVKLGNAFEFKSTGSSVDLTFKEGIYLDSIVTSPLSTFEIGNVTATLITQAGSSISIYQYAIEIIVTAEDGTTTKTFTHYINEEIYNTYIYRIFINGGVEVDEILGDDADEQNSDYIYESSFEREETPSYRFEYMLDQFYTTNDSSYFKVQFFDALGNKIDTPDGVTVVVTEGLDFEVEFSSDAESTDYYFAMVYSHEIPFKTGQTNSWEVTFDKIHITKNKNRDSYLDNITFFSESVTASIRTMITVNEINLETYQGMLANPTRDIVCLPGQIYYNQYEWSYVPDTMNKEADFYVIGLVNKTELDYYTPDFTLPEGATIYRTETAGGVVYRYVPYYVDDLQSLTIFLVSEDGTSIKDTAGADITVTDATAEYTSFTYDGQSYKISPVAGYQTIVYDGKTIDNISLRTDFNEFGSYSEELQKFNFVNYRVYSEMYSDHKTADYFTDYKVAAQDLTNNIKFNIIIDYSTDASDITNLIKNVFIELACYALPEDYKGEDPLRDQYKPYNKTGIFAYFQNGSNVLTHGNLKSNTSGYYNLYVSLPDGYDVTFTVTDKGNTTPYTQAGEFYVQSAITARTIDVHITIKKATPSNDDWGVHVQENSNKK